MVFDALKKNLESWAQKKQTKYESLPKEVLLKRDLQKQRNTTRHAKATTIAGGVTVVSHGALLPVHGSLAARHVAKLAQQKAKSEITERVVEDKGFTRRQPNWRQNLADHARGTADGGVGIDTINSFLNKWGSF